MTAEHLWYRFPRGAQALRGVSLDVAEGEMIGVIGPNGSGKSTLLRLMTGLLRPDRGEVTLDGRAIRSLDRRALARQVAFLPQQIEAPFDFSCREVVAQGRYPHLSAMGFLTTEDLRIVDDAMARTETLTLADRPLTSLSGGERQRVLIAATLAQQARRLFLDEPTTALDIHHQAGIFALLRQIARDGASVMVVIHDLNLAAQFCDRLILLSVGAVVADGPPGDVLNIALLAPVYGANVAIAENPLTGGPLVVVLTPECLPRQEAAPCRS